MNYGMMFSIPGILILLAFFAISAYIFFRLAYVIAEMLIEKYIGAYSDRKRLKK